MEGLRSQIDLNDTPTMGHSPMGDTPPFLEEEALGDLALLLLVELREEGMWHS
jgi:hypothetical protein